MPQPKNLSDREIVELLNYDPETGIVSRKKDPGGRRRVKKASHPKGYVTLCVNYRDYLAHRLAWLCTYGSWPTGVIDHINGDRSDNRICNLRDVSLIENQWNAKVRSHNATGIKGVQIKIEGSYTRFVAIIRANGVKEHLGTFRTAEEAEEVVRKRREELHGEFARHG